ADPADRLTPRSSESRRRQPPGCRFSWGRALFSLRGIIEPGTCSSSPAGILAALPGGGHEPCPSLRHRGVPQRVGEPSPARGLPPADEGGVRGGEGELLSLAQGDAEPHPHGGLV